MIKLEKTDGTAVLTLADPPLNIITRAMMERIRESLAELAADHTLRVLLLNSTGKHFSAGADVEEHIPPQDRELIGEFTETVLALDRFPIPVVAAVGGKCLGGGFELVMPADIIVASENASFGQPEILLGVIPPAACALLGALIPAGAAAEAVFTGDPISADEALRLGLVRKVVPQEQLDTAATETTEKIARQSAAALRNAKKALRGSGADRREADLREASRIYLDELMRTHDAMEGLQSFVEKRRPVWKHS